MSALTFTLSSVEGHDYDVHRDGVLLGHVARVEAQKSVIGRDKARLSIVIRWQFQVIGQKRCRSLYTTRKHAAEALAGQYDAHARAKRATEKDARAEHAAIQEGRAEEWKP